MNQLTITRNDGVTHIELNGADITNAIAKVDVELAPRTLPQVRLTLPVTKLDIELDDSNLTEVLGKAAEHIVTLFKREPDTTSLCEGRP